MPGAEFVELVEKYAQLETDENVLNFCLELASPVLFNYVGRGEHRENYASSLFRILSRFPQFQKLRMRFCYKKADIVEMFENLEDLSNEQRWEIVKKYREHSQADFYAKDDVSDEGHLGKIYI